LNESTSRIEAFQEFPLTTISADYLLKQCKFLNFDFKKASIYLAPKFGLLLPNFSEAEVFELAQLEAELPDGHYWQKEAIKGQTICSVSALSQELNRVAQQVLGFGQIQSLSWALNTINLHQSTLEKSKLLIWHLSDEISMVSACSGKSVSFFNSFVISSTEDLMYYTLSILEELDWKNEDTTINISGKLSSGQLNEKMLSEYLANHQLPTTISGIDLRFVNESERNKNYVLLNTFRCE
jgi:hypothetical protein